MLEGKLKGIGRGWELYFLIDGTLDVQDIICSYCFKNHKRGAKVEGLPHLKLNHSP